MSKIKSLILGSVAGLATIAGAQAADLPVKAKAVQYVKICSLYGAGFYYIPGTDTCIKLGGYAQFDATINGSAHGQPAWNNSGNTGLQNRSSDAFITRTRVNFNVDTRTASEYGVVRTYWSSNFQHTSGEAPSAGTLTLDFGFVQFAGFTFGKAISVFQTPWGGSPINLNTSNLLGGYDNSTGITQIAYTWQFGNGLSASVAVEDNKTITRAPLYNGAVIPANSALFTGAFANASGGNVSPDFTGNIRLDQAAFTAQLSGGVHNLHAGYYGTTEPTGHPSDEWGFAIQGGIQLKNLPTGPGDKLSFSAIYTDGAPKYAIGGTTGNSFDAFNNSGTSGAGFYQSFAVASLQDGVYTTGGSIQKTKVWAVQGGYEHNWNANWQTGVFGSYVNVNYNDTASAILRTGYAPALTAGSTFNPDFKIWQIGSRTAWTPVQNLTLSGEVLYTTIDQSSTGGLTATAAGNAGAFKPAGVYEFKDQGILSGQLRVRRTW
ncbi:MAG: porin [Afipia sp.]